MINVKIKTKAKGSTAGSSGSGSGSGGSSAVIINQVDEARHALLADRATQADTASYAEKAGAATNAKFAEEAGTLSADSEIYDQFIRKDIDDTAHGTVTFGKGIVVSDETEDDHEATAQLDVPTTINAKTVHNGVTDFNQDWNLTMEKTGRVAGVLQLRQRVSTGSDFEWQERGRIDGNTGNAVFQDTDVKNDLTVHSVISELTGVPGDDVKFVDGFNGKGMKIWKDSANLWHITADYLTIRNQMRVFELLIQRIRATGGTVVISPAAGKIKSVAENVNETYTIEIEGANEFAAGDIARCQTWGSIDNSAVGNKSYYFKVQGSSGKYIYVMKADPGLSYDDGEDNVTYIVPEVGDELVQWGNDSNTARQNLIYLSATESNVMGESNTPCIDMMGGCNYPDVGTIHVRVGLLDGVDDSAKWGTDTPSGWGFYGDNCYLKGKFILVSDDGNSSARFVLDSNGLNFQVIGADSSTSIVTNENFSAMVTGAHLVDADQLINQLADYATHRDVDDATSGMVTTSDMATMFSGVWNTTTQTFDALALMKAYVFQNDGETLKSGILLDADQIDQVAENISITADRIDFKGFTDINGMTVDTKGNLTIDGVVNNNLMVVARTASDGVKACKDVFSCTNNGDNVMPANIWLDPLSLGRMVKLTSDFQGQTINLPWMNHDSGYAYTGYDTERRGMTLDELRKSVGKKFTFYNTSTDTNITVQFVCGILDDGWIIQEENSFNYSQSQQSEDLSKMGMNTGYTMTKTQNRVYNIAIHGQGWVELEFCLGNYKNEECFYWKARYIDASILTLTT